MWSTFHDILRPALAGLTVTIHDQVAEGDKVTTRKTVSGRHTGTLFGVEREAWSRLKPLLRVCAGRSDERRPTHRFRRARSASA
ncbi:ester cyclase [Xanthomonas sp. PPL139]